MRRFQVRPFSPPPLPSGGVSAPVGGGLDDALLQALMSVGQQQEAPSVRVAPGSRRVASGGGRRAGGVAHTRPGSPVPGVSRHRSTHETAGLPGYPAFDYMARAGTPAVAPVSGRVTRLSGHDPKAGPTNGPHGPFGLSVYIRGDDGRVYYMTHMGSRLVRAGERVRRGQRIGNVGNYAKWGGADHIHMGVHG